MFFGPSGIYAVPAVKYFVQKKSFRRYSNGHRKYHSLALPIVVKTISHAYNKGKEYDNNGLI